MKNKKGMLEIGYMLIITFIVAVFAIFTSVLIYESIGEYGIERLYDQSVIFNNNSQISDDMLVHETELRDNYKDFNWYPDIFTIYILLIGMSMAMLAAYKTRKAGFPSFVGWLTIGSYLFLLIFGIVLQFIEWFWSQYFEKLFFDLSYSVVFTEWLIAHGGEAFFISFIILVFINKFEMPGTTKEGEDFNSIPDEEIFIDEGGFQE